MPAHFSFQSYSWSLGTTSFRMANFHRKVEEQLFLLKEFWDIPENRDASWTGDSTVQVKYYDFIYSKGFVTGDIADNFDKKAKTARQKTSGLVDIGLIDYNRRMTSVGKALLDICNSGDFSSDNEFKIPKDSYIYFKQLLKTTYRLQEDFVRPYLITGTVLNRCDDYLTDDEFTYFLPLCINRKITDNVIDYIIQYRAGEISIDEVIADVVLTRYSYPEALEFFLSSSQSDEDIMTIGMNRDGIRHDKCYVELYRQLKMVYVDKDETAVVPLYQAARKVKNKCGTLWRKLLFSAKKPKSIEDLSPNVFNDISGANQFNEVFFKYLHLHKIKANLSDYKDLNRRYLNITDSILFADGKVCFTPIFQNFFKTGAKSVFYDTYTECALLQRDCALSDINSSLVFDNSSVVSAFNEKNDVALGSIDEVYDYVENDRYKRFRELIDSKFSNAVIMDMLDKFETRQSDNEIMGVMSCEADVPTIFEYITAVAWYRISGYEGKILDYMNLSLDVNLLPRTHAGGGKSDIVYKYRDCDSYPAHDLLIECTLMEGMTQRHGEMEPVSRHLANYMIDENPNAYCTFVSNNLHASVISDFRGRKSTPYYRNNTEHVDGMKIIPLHTQELKVILEKGISYDRLYGLFEEAYVSEDVKAPPEWYNKKIKKATNYI
ncbi:MAG: AlwI family type II restriction endonuclease [Ruminococcus sp.]|nr:AlwI family type II restriction endonuclease [Ruminococcus sp.]